MATYSSLKYKGLLAAGFAKTTDVTVSINAKAVETKRSIIGQLDREIAGGDATTTIFLDSIIGGNAATTSFTAEYDGGSANG